MSGFLENDVSTALLEASTYGHNEVIEVLISNGGVVNMGNYDSVTPLHFACLSGKASTVNLLIEKGAKVNAWNVDGSTPLCDACCSGSRECVRILLANGADVNPRLCLTSPLHEAMLRDQWECAKLLTDAGAKLDVMDCHFGTPLHIAAWKQHMKSGFVILKAGANVNSLKMCETPLHYSAKAKDTSFISMLIDFGADVYATDNRGLLASGHVPDNHPIQMLLQHFQANPRRLTDWCRLNIRKAIGTKRLSQIKTLNFPTYLKNYLEYWEYSHLLSSKPTSLDMSGQCVT
ncbi:ankyrin repeat and SOCS box protein 13-like isoform X2 [Lineus longissimus]|uniref:ankyrin repeat and SOCS box protein 13-like isoform X2 n=1 Tax=Lineus longissimus TaxID=88925 RepID=UPI002B4E6277